MFQHTTVVKVQIITVMGVHSGIDGIFHDSEALKPRFNLLAPLTADLNMFALSLLQN